MMDKRNEIKEHSNSFKRTHKQDRDTVGNIRWVEGAVSAFLTEHNC